MVQISFSGHLERFLVLVVRIDMQSSFLCNGDPGIKLIAGSKGKEFVGYRLVKAGPVKRRLSTALSPKTFRQ